MLQTHELLDSPIKTYFIRHNIITSKGEYDYAYGDVFYHWCYQGIKIIMAIPYLVAMTLIEKHKAGTLSDRQFFNYCQCSYSELVAFEL